VPENKDLTDVLLAHLPDFRLDKPEPNHDTIQDAIEHAFQQVISDSQVTDSTSKTRPMTLEFLGVTCNLGWPKKGFAASRNEPFPNDLINHRITRTPSGSSTQTAEPGTISDGEGPIRAIHPYGKSGSSDPSAI
jgi:hypothetical protein